MVRLSFLLSFVAVLALAPALPAAAPVVRPAPLHQRIDQHFAAIKDFARRSAPPASDAEFLRRIYLDLTGNIPSASEARAFLSSRAPDKRRALIDRLLASPEHARHMAQVFDVLLMERRVSRFVPQAQWHEYLRSSFAANKPWDQITREILGADGADPKLRAPVKFILDRNAEPNLLTRDISRLFLGMNLQCAQCHNHPRIEDYKQEHYYGLFAFVNRTSVVVDPKLRTTVLSEKADGEVTFQSVFDPAKVTKTTPPRLPGGPALSDPTDPKLKGYLVAPAGGAPARGRGVRFMRAGRFVPRYSRRALLAPQVARADYEPFRRNIANRLWALMMGRGLVHPLDMDHPANPPSHPELLDMLSREIAGHKFDIKWFLREIALSQAYQRSSAMPAGVAERDVPLFGVARLKPLSPEQLAWSLMEATGIVENMRLSLGKSSTEATIYARLSPSVAPFVSAFGGQAGTTEGFDARVDQALFVANGPILRSWVAPIAGGLTTRLAGLKGDALADELYLSVLTRLPDNDERKEVADFLAARPADRPRALQDLVWALLASAEFRFNH
jgi:hypothetical protein